MKVIELSSKFDKVIKILFFTSVIPVTMLYLGIGVLSYNLVKVTVIFLSIVIALIEWYRIVRFSKKRKDQIKKVRLNLKIIRYEKLLGILLIILSLNSSTKLSNIFFVFGIALLFSKVE